MKPHTFEIDPPTWRDDATAAEHALDAICNALAVRPRLTAVLLCALIYGAFYFAGTP